MENVNLKNEGNNANTLLYAVKNGQLKRWFYEFHHGHSFLLEEEANQIVFLREWLPNFRLA